MEQREAIKGLMKKSEIQGSDIDYVLMGYVASLSRVHACLLFSCFSALIQNRMVQYGYPGGSDVEHCARSCNGCWPAQQHSCQHSHTRMHLKQRVHCRRNESHSVRSCGHSLGRRCGGYVGSSHQVSMSCAANWNSEQVHHSLPVNCKE
jgi:hypothetical protein